MIFDEIEELNAIVALSRSNAKTRRFYDTHDPEVNRLFNGSPPLSHTGTFETESLMKSGEKSTALAKAELKAERKGVTISEILRPLPEEDRKKMFSPLPVTIKSTFQSNLSSLLESKPSASLMSSSSGKRMKLTIYLPDLSPFEVLVSENDSFEDVIQIVLKQHKEEGRRPELYYHCPEMYELRMHEGDGEPDRDFPALDKSKTLKSFNLNEYCLCETDDDFLDIEPDELDNALAGLKMGRFGEERGERNVDDSGRDSDFDMPTSHLNGNGNSNNGGANIGDDAILIIIPNAENLKLPIDEDVTLKGLLPQIADLLACRGHKLRLHSDEFSFVVTSDDQAKLKMISPVVSLESKVKGLGVKKLELQKRVFADSVRTSRAPGLFRRQQQENHGGEVVYNDTLAVVYQEWNVVKKNKFGRKQERIIGIDGKMVYNSRRDKFKANQSSSVYRAQRDINTIRKVEVVEGDEKTVRIQWEEENAALYDIEYTCESAKDCADIVAKLSYLIARQKR